VTSSKHPDMFLGNSGLCYKVQLYYIACGFLALASVLVFARLETVVTRVDMVSSLVIARLVPRISCVSPRS
jgi:hypothetical protein